MIQKQHAICCKPTITAIRDLFLRMVSTQLGPDHSDEDCEDAFEDAVNGETEAAEAAAEGAAEAMEGPAAPEQVSDDDGDDSDDDTSKFVAGGASRVSAFNPALTQFSSRTTALGVLSASWRRSHNFKTLFAGEMLANYRYMNT